MDSTILYLEPVGGIAGDMFLAAALDLGVPLEALEAPLRTLGVAGWTFARSTQVRHALSGTHLDVVVEKAAHEHRALSEIEKLIAASGLSAKAKERATKVFRLLGKAEAKVHGIPLETVHFHEVGAVDSIVDICGAAVALELLGDPEVFCAPPPLGSGTARTAHGVIPVPVPATLELLKNVPVRFEGLGELTTPTGAALVRAFATVGPPPELVVEKTGYGVGTKDFADRANVLRASLGRRGADAASRLWVLETNLDDCSPQLLGLVLEKALEKGALDAWVLPAVMKKSRPGHLVGVLCDAEHRSALEALLFRETTTLGVRATSVERTALERRFDPVTTPFGEVKVKVGSKGGEVLNAQAELEDCRALAEKADVPVKDVQAAAMAAWRARR